MQQHFKHAVLCCLLVPAANAAATYDELQLVEDLNQAQLGSTSGNKTGVMLDGNFFFTVETPGSPSQIWRSDGTSAGTAQLTSMPDGVDDMAALGDRIVFIKGRALFSIDGDTRSQELWITNGTQAGTAPIDAAIPWDDPAILEELTPWQGIVYFDSPVGLTSTDGSNIEQVIDADGQWVAGANDMTVIGTTSPYLAMVGKLNGEGEYRLVTYDGVRFHAFEQRPDAFVALDDQLLFVEQELDTGNNAVYVQSAADEAPLQIATFIENTDPSTLVMAATASQAFIVQDGRLWATDGTAAGTREIAVSEPGFRVDHFRLATVGNLAVFGATTDAYGSELWLSDGTAAGTQLALDVHPSGDSTPGCFSRIGKALLFCADDGTHGREPWVFDGTSAQLLEDINPAGDGYGNDAAYAIAGASRTIFHANDGEHGPQPWITDGTATGTYLLAAVNDITASGYLNPGSSTGGRHYFLGSDGRQEGLWQFDGDEFTFLAASDPRREITSFTTGGQTYIAGSGWDANNRMVTWKIEDGITSELDFASLGITLIENADVCAVNGRLVVHGIMGVHATDGTPQDTRELQTARNTLGTANCVTMNDSVYFTAQHSIWRTDGTPEGTTQVVAGNGSIYELFATDEQLVYQVRDQAVDKVLTWDGSGGPVVIAEDTNVGDNAGFHASYLVPVLGDSGFYLVGINEAEGDFMSFHSDGTLYDANRLSIRGEDLRIAVAITDGHGSAYLLEEESESNVDRFFRLLRHDTVRNEVTAVTAVAGNVVHVDKLLGHADGWIYFSGISDEGIELWRVAPGGDTAEPAIAADAQFTSMHNLFHVGDRHFVTAHDTNHGMEIHELHVTKPAVPVEREPVEDSGGGTALFLVLLGLPGLLARRRVKTR
ncbi:MAG TPA: hypothetical protein VF275_09160 [Gammaproteobacteria bacterium]